MSRMVRDVGFPIVVSLVLLYALLWGPPVKSAERITDAMATLTRELQADRAARSYEMKELRELVERYFKSGGKK